MGLGGSRLARARWAHTATAVASLPRLARHPLETKQPGPRAAHENRKRPSPHRQGGVWRSPHCGATRTWPASLPGADGRRPGSGL